MARNTRVLLDIGKFALIAFLIATPFRFFIAQPFIVAGASMEPTIDPHEYLVVDEISYRFEEPARGDVVVFRYPFDPDQYFVKRIVGLPGETVEVVDGKVLITPRGGEPIVLDEPYLADESEVRASRAVTLTSDEYFVLGDNRRISSDSRQWGPLQERFIIGHVVARLYPFTEAGLFPGAYRFP